MIDPATTQNRFEALKVCVLIPTFNNASALAAVVNDVRGFTSNIIIVNDGSTDNTVDILNSFPDCHCIHFPHNRGKGMALRKGFDAAVQSGYDYVITLDSDGQHFAKDLPAFLDKIEEVPGSIIIGARNMEQESVPGKSSFGHNFSNFWFWVETGLKPLDTQSGYRLYPVQRLKDFHFFTVKYEFEIEVLVRAAWSGIRIDFVGIDVYYPPAEERITHFRPFKDFSRISVLNSVLVTIALFYIKPRDFVRALFNRDKVKSFVKEHVLGSKQSDELKSSSIAFGVFMGIIPVWGFQLLIAIFLSMLLRLNKPLVIVAAHVSITPMIPVIIFISYKMGAFILGDRATEIQWTTDISLSTIGQYWEQYFYGSILLACLAASIAGVLSFILFKLFKRKAGLAG